jgi:hypothetical protein
MNQLDIINHVFTALELPPADRSTRAEGSAATVPPQAAQEGLLADAGTAGVGDSSEQR